MKSSKAVSPLVAAVLLIAITMTIAGMLAYWAQGFVRQQTDTFSNQTIISKCQFANFEIYSCSYNTSAQEVRLILHNFETVELRNLTAFIVYPDGRVTNTNLNGTLPTGFIKSYTIPGVHTGYSSILVKTECPGLSVSKSC